MSYYPHWNGGLSFLLDNMNGVSQKYGKDVMIAETDTLRTDAYKHAGESLGDIALDNDWLHLIS